MEAKTTTKGAGDMENKFRFWRVHFESDPAAHWLNIDCGKPVTEKQAVALAEKAITGRGSITNAVADFR